MSNEAEKLATISAKLPSSLRDAFNELAKRRRLTPSRLLRALAERELAGAPDGDPPGEVETAVHAELAERGLDASSARAAAAVNLARRIDRDPTSGAVNVAQLRHLLVELVPVERAEDSFDALDAIRFSALLVEEGFEIWSVADRGYGTYAFPDPVGSQRVVPTDAILTALRRCRPGPSAEGRHDRQRNGGKP